MHKRLSRRHFLRAAGGISVALPILHSLGARAQDAAAVGPKRLILFYNPNGTVHDAWWPSNVTSETDFTLGEIHQPLAAFQDRLLILKGINLASAAVGPGGPHQRGIGSLFTGRELQSGEFTDGCGSKAGWANGISVDQEIVKNQIAVTPLASLELGIRAAENDVQARISYAGAGQPLPPMNSPLDVYNRLFSSFDVPAEELDQLLAQRRSVLDAVKMQFSLVREKASSEDRDRLDRHVALVRDLELRLNALSGGGSGCSKPATPPALDPNDEAAMPEITRLQLDLLAVAFACDMTRVASVQISTALNRIRFPWLDSLEEGHSLSHKLPTDLQARAELVKRAQWHAQQLAYLMDRLATIPEGDGKSVLDNTLIVWGNEVSVGNTHAHDSMPFLLAGGSGYFETGRYLEFAGASHNDLLVSILNAMDVPAETFGLADFCTGPLTGLTA